MRLIPALLVFLFLCACGAEPAPVPAWRGEDNLIEVTLHDIHCEGCVVEVEKALGAVEDVATVVVDFETNHVLVMLQTEADREAAIPALREAIHGAGHKVVGEDPRD